MTYSTHHRGLAAVLRFALGAESHRRTFSVENDRIYFEFHDPANECPSLEKEFFSGDGAMVSDARKLLEASAQLYKTVSIALRDGQWRNERQ